ncbi:cytochrome P450 [Aspergillus karnatakaensis]|uniref:cytochrome P450 n=1 Tax=Aspergillus karnatakaensis TaxID=1810916 RepID=UPI003CCDF2BF
MPLVYLPSALDTKSFTRDVLVKQLHLKFDIQNPVVERLFTPDPVRVWNSKSTRSVDAAEHMMDIYHRHISPGDSLDAFLDNEIIPRIQTALLVPENLDTNPTQPFAVSLCEICTDAFIKGLVASYYGDIMFELEPDFVEWYLQWERLSWKCIFGLPGSLSKDMITARAKLVDAFFRYFSMAPTKRGHSNFWTQGVQRSLRELDLSNEKIARIFMMQTWGYGVTFWLVAHLVQDRSLLETITLEVQGVVDSNQKTPINHGYLVDECPKLDALFEEILRLTVTSPLVRGITSTSTIGGKALREGNQVLHCLGFDSAKATSYALFNDSTLKSSLAYRPWGGGKTLCPGRFLARKAVFAFVACLLGRFEVETEVGAPFPRADLSTTTPGSAAVAEGEDVVLLLRSKIRA